MRSYKTYDSNVVIGVCIHTHVEAVFSVGGHVQGWDQCCTDNCISYRILAIPAQKNLYWLSAVLQNESFLFNLHKNPTVQVGVHYFTQIYMAEFGVEVCYFPPTYMYIGVQGYTASQRTFRETVNLGPCTQKTEVTSAVNISPCDLPFLPYLFQSKNQCTK